MATVAFAVLPSAGTFFAGPVGGMLGAAIGSYIDNAFIMPALFPQDPVAGQSLQEMQLMGADEGSPVIRSYSRRTKPAGTVIWTPPFFNKFTITHGGKGGGGGTEEQLYTVDVAVTFGNGPEDGLGVEAIDKIYADTTLIYDNSPNVAISSTSLSCTVDDEFREVFTFGAGYVSTLHSRTLVVASPIGGPDLSELLSGNDAVIGGWVETDYNGTFRVISSDLEVGGTSTARFKLPITASNAGEAAGATVTIDQTNPKFDTAKVSNVTIYLGTEAQTKDSFITGIEGVTNTPGYRGEIYAVVEGLHVKDYGNRIPNFRAEVFVNSTDDLQDVVDDIMDETDLAVSEWNSTALAGVSCKGYLLRGPMPTVSKFQPLSTAFSMLAQDLNGVMTFFLRANAASVTITETDLAAHPLGSSNEEWPHKLDRADWIIPPSEIDIKYAEENNNLQPGSQVERRQGSGTTYQKKIVELPITLNGGEARDIAARLIWTAKTGQVEHSISVPPSYIQIVENDRVIYTYEGETYTFLVGEVAEGADGTRLLTGFAELPAHMTQTSPHEDPRKPGTRLSSPYDTQLEVIDVGPLQPATTVAPGMYFTVVSKQQGVTWKGASLYESNDGGTTWTLIGPMNGETVMGRTTTALTEVLDTAHWDRATTLVVTLEFGTLSSVSEIDCLNGLNRAVVGQEVIGFQTATLSASQPSIGTSYDLTKLLRGLAGTEVERSIHSAGERFVMLHANNAVFVEFGTTHIGGTRDFVAVAPGGDQDDYDAQNVPILCNNIRPMHPVHLFGNRNLPATNDWTVDFTRRPRVYFRIFSQAPPVSEPVEDYVVEVRNGSDVVVATYTSTITANGSGITGTQFVYDAADQTVDFGGVQSTIRLRIFQVSDLAGRGKGTATTVFTG